jgi:hypothetical protein
MGAFVGRLPFRPVGGFPARFGIGEREDWSMRSGKSISARSLAMSFPKGLLAWMLLSGFDKGEQKGGLSFHEQFDCSVDTVDAVRSVDDLDERSSPFRNNMVNEADLLLLLILGLSSSLPPSLSELTDFVNDLVMRGSPNRRSQEEERFGLSFAFLTVGDVDPTHDNIDGSSSFTFFIFATEVVIVCVVTRFTRDRQALGLGGERCSDPQSNPSSTSAVL